MGDDSRSIFFEEVADLLALFLLASSMAGRGAFFLGLLTFFSAASVVEAPGLLVFGEIPFGVFFFFGDSSGEISCDWDVDGSPDKPGNKEVRKVKPHSSLIHSTLLYLQQCPKYDPSYLANRYIFSEMQKCFANM